MKSLVWTTLLAAVFLAACGGEDLSPPTRTTTTEAVTTTAPATTVPAEPTTTVAETTTTTEATTTTMDLSDRERMAAAVETGDEDLMLEWIDYLLEEEGFVAGSQDCEDFGLAMVFLGGVDGVADILREQIRTDTSPDAIRIDNEEALDRFVDLYVTAMAARCLSE